MVKLKLFANCVPVKGKNRSVICDLQRNSLKLIPNDLYFLLEKYDGYTVKEIKKAYDNNFDEIIDEYVDLLIGNEFAFFTSNPQLFPNLIMQWDAPFDVTNSIIDFDSKSEYNILKAIEQIDQLNCKHIQIRLFTENNEIIQKILEFLNELKSIIHSVDILTPNSGKNMDHWKNLMNNFPRLNQLILSDNSKNVSQVLYEVESRKIISIQNEVNSAAHCGIIDSKYFAVNIPNFTESKRNNSCLNSKISIDKNGDIRNCPSMPDSYGNIKDTTLKEAINNPDFKKYWNVTKDQIDVCKDCEFRYVCTDCRAYTERSIFKEDIDLSKPLKCGYNPYTNEWAEWSVNPLKQTAIEYYGMQDLVEKNV